VTQSNDIVVHPRGCRQDRPLVVIVFPCRVPVQFHLAQLNNGVPVGRRERAVVSHDARLEGLAILAPRVRGKGDLVVSSLDSSGGLVVKSLGQKRLAHVVAERRRGAKDDEKQDSRETARHEEDKVGFGLVSAQVRGVGGDCGTGRRYLEHDEEELKDAERDKGDSEARHEPLVVNTARALAYDRVPVRCCSSSSLA
jgi:hypothetical protein